MASEIRVTNIKANDGTASLTVADSTGNLSVGGSLTASGGIANAGTITAGTLGASVNLPSFVGMVASFAMSTPPTGWLACDGSAVSRVTYANLFGIISTTWGAGDGSTTFNIPDLRGAFLRGTGTSGTSSDYVGPAVGAYQDDQNASHNHSGSTNTTGSHNHTFNYQGSIAGAAGYPYHTSGGSPSRTYTVTSNGNHSHSLTINSDGGTEARVYNRGVQYCIKF